MGLHVQVIPFIPKLFLTISQKVLSLMKTSNHLHCQTEMTTAEKELDQNTNFDWNRIQESGQEVEPLVGPGYTGLINLGNR